MKLELTKEKFLENVLIAERFSSKHVSLPILSSILLTAGKDGFSIKATNLDVGIELLVSSKPQSQEWSVAVSPQALKAFLANVSNKNVELELESGVLTVSVPESSATISIQAPDDFPLIPQVSDGETLTLPSKVFIEGVMSVSYSASVSSIKPELSSIYIYPLNEEIVFVATDSFRLAEKRVKVSKKNLTDSILLPFKNALEIARVLDVYGGDVAITATKNQVAFKVDDVYISSRAVDGTFPDYKQIIPKTFDSEVTLLKEEFTKALKLTGGFVDKFQQVVCTVSPTEKSLTLKTKGGTEGEASQTIKATGSGNSLSITFNHRYLADCLQSIKSESLTMKLVGNNKPVIITESSHPSFTYLVMPMNR